MTQDPDSTEYQQGVSALDSGDYRAAITHFQIELAKSFDGHEVIYLLGRAHAGLDEHNIAITCQKRAIELFPEFPEARYELACSLIATNKPTEAKIQLDVALKQLLPGEELAEKIQQQLDRIQTNE